MLCSLNRLVSGVSCSLFIITDDDIYHTVVVFHSFSCHLSFQKKLQPTSIQTRIRGKQAHLQIKEIGRRLSAKDTGSKTASGRIVSTQLSSVCSLETSVLVNDKSNVCRTCQTAFSTSSNLQRHERIHSGERHYTCSICHKSFTQSWELRSHERIHSGERPYTCKTCHKSFSQSSNLQRHERIHSGEKALK